MSAPLMTKFAPAGISGYGRIAVRERPATTVDRLHLDSDVDRVPGQRPIPQHQPVVRVAVLPAPEAFSFRHNPARDDDDLRGSVGRCTPAPARGDGSEHGK